MKPVESVSVGGYVFTFEDDACAVARQYLDELDSFYSKKESGEEIMEGIEERMSELLFEKCGATGVVSLQMVNGVIAALGRPEAIEEESEDDPDLASESNRISSDSPKASSKASGPEIKPAEPVRKRLYRDPSHGKIAGVCSGLGTYLDCDPLLFRLIFTLLTLGCFCIDGRTFLHVPLILTMPVLYAVLWICMPAAKTVRQRDELRGESGTVDEISAKIRSGASEVADAASRVGRSDFWPVFGRICAVVFGIVFLIAGVALLAGVGAVVWGKEIVGNNYLYNMLLERLSPDFPSLFSFITMPSVLVLIALVVLLPAVGMIYGGTMMVFNLKSPVWRPGLCIFILWLIVLVVLSVLAFMVAGTGRL